MTTKDKVYIVSDDSWVDGYDDCPCCSGLTFECYNAVNFEQNGSAHSLHELYSNIILDLLGISPFELIQNPYDSFEEEELLEVLKRNDITILLDGEELW